MAMDVPADQPVCWRERLAPALSRQVIRKSITAAILVGSLLILLNQGDLLWSGQITGRLVIKSFITPLIPFCVTMLGAILNSGHSTRPEALRPGWAAVRRSLIIAVIVGSAILLVNQGDLLLSGQIAPLLWFKIVITPCVPFCVSLYGAYLAYHNAIATQPSANREPI